jgi:hypothetical protein
MDKKEILQAVLFADNFSDCFEPFTSFNSPVSCHDKNYQRNFLIF